MSELIDVWSRDFADVCRMQGLDLRAFAPEEAGISEAFAAQFVMAALRRSRWLRWRFPRALHGGSNGGFARWIERNGARRFGLSAAATKKIRGAFRRAPGQRIYDIYLQDRELQRLYPLALAPAGQQHFLGWLATHGRRDQNVQDHEVLWFLHESAEAVGEGIALTYAVTPAWQEQFPLALTADRWPAFRQMLLSRFPALQRWRRPLRDVPVLERLTPVAAEEGVLGANVLSHFCYPSGIQQAALWTKTALERAGLGTSCRDVPAGVRTTLLPRADWLGLEVYPFSIITVAPTPYFADAYERSGLFRRPDVYRIAYWAWELERIPAEWVQLLPLLDEIWSPTEFVTEAMRSRMTVPIHTMPPGVELGPLEPVMKDSLGIAADEYVFLFMFDMYSEFRRKNPLAVIRAFRRAFPRGEKAALVIKLSRGHGDPAALEQLREAAEAHGVILIDEVVSRAKAYGFLEMCDCFVSLHRSEGFGLGMAESMLLGKPVIATGYSGNLSFMNRDNSMLVDYTLVDIAESGPVYAEGNFWADPAEEQAAAFMRQVFEDREAARSLGGRAQEELREKLSLRAAGERMATRLREMAATREP
ncbi:glycosyltransferase family 4 protein [soil metagenome]